MGDKDGDPLVSDESLFRRFDQYIENGGVMAENLNSESTNSEIRNLDRFHLVDDRGRVNDLRGEGLKVIACRKFPGSVLYGIKWLQNRRIVIDPARTPNAHREFISYEYMTTKDGEFLADVPDKDNDAIDATRYALDRLINNRRISA